MRPRQAVSATPSYDEVRLILHEQTGMRIKTEMYAQETDGRTTDVREHCGASRNSDASKTVMCVRTLRQPETVTHAAGGR